MKVLCSLLTRQLPRLLGIIVATLFASALHANPGEDNPGIQQAIEAKQRVVDVLFQKRGIVAVGVGATPSGIPLIKVYTDGSPVRGVPPDIEGFATEVVPAARLVAGQATEPGPRANWDYNFPIGLSVGHTSVTAGTLGCQLSDAGACHPSADFFLSNNHVLANSNNAAIGDYILQPGKADGGTYPDDAIAQLWDYQPINFSETASNIMDAAVGWYTAGGGMTRTPREANQEWYIMQGGFAGSKLNMAVMKYGRTTRLTRGKIDSLKATALVDYPGGRTARFVDQLVIVPAEGYSDFTKAGDSGAVIVADGGLDDRRALGLHFAGGGGLSIANPILPILSRFNMVVVGGN